MRGGGEDVKELGGWGKLPYLSSPEVFPIMKSIK